MGKKKNLLGKRNLYLPYGHSAIVHVFQYNALILDLCLNEFQCRLNVTLYYCPVQTHLMEDDCIYGQ